MSFNNVSPGQAWRPEPAARYNAVNTLLNNTVDRVDSPGGGLPNNIIMGYAPGDKELTRYSTVVLVKLHNDPGAEVLNGQCCMEIAFGNEAAEYAQKNTPIYGVTLDFIFSDRRYVPVQIYGLVPFTSSNYSTSDPLFPGKALVPSLSGKWVDPVDDDTQVCATVVVPPRHGSDYNSYGVLSLPPLFSYGFKGMFKLIPLSTTSCRVVNGANHNAQYCGTVYAKKPINVEAQTFNFGSSTESNWIYLIMHYKRSYDKNTGKFSVEYSARLDTKPGKGNYLTTDEEDFLTIYLGYFKNGSCHQSYTKGNVNIADDYGWYL